MDTKNRIGLYGAYFLGVAGIGFTLPYLPLFLGQRGMSDRTIGLLMTLAALTSLAQFPVGIWSDRIGGRKPFLLAALAALAVATFLLPKTHQPLVLGFLVVLFAENGVCRACLESLSGAEATALARPGELGRALGALRFWKPTGVVLVALIASVIVERYGVESIFPMLIVFQALAFGLALLIHEEKPARNTARAEKASREPEPRGVKESWFPRDPALWTFVAAMVLFHMANAPGGVYLGLFMERRPARAEALLAYAFVVSMIAWMLVVLPAGRMADRFGRRPLLIAGWSVMAIRLGIVAISTSPWMIIANQALDGLSNGLFAVLAAAWVTDRLGDPRRAGEAQVIVGCSLVLGSAIGPALTGLVVESLGYRAVFGLLAGVGVAATLLVAFRVPETLTRNRELASDGAIEPLAALGEMSATS